MKNNVHTINNGRNFTFSLVYFNELIPKNMLIELCL
ncbi:hypothetical protein DI53_2479 [Sphingobacterium deserti]|uniref:Uncharacterized protein n=1 Tax=Sphingobacterium deserti TaxID=1229276 RepID=A0A0B8T6M6_9SPHI|nr:hypothetical protein DI53_2479 [Sphingobacterium deserti]